MENLTLGNGHFTVIRELEQLLKAIVPPKCDRSPDLQQSLFNVPRKESQGLRGPMNTAPARLLGELIGLSRLQRAQSHSLPATQILKDDLRQNSLLESNIPPLKFSFSHQFNRTYTLEDQVRHKNFLEDASNLLNKVETCAFCKRNGSPFFNHPLKDKDGGTVCPVLSRFTCKMCAATGRNAHTHKYCKNNPYTRGDPIAVGMAPGPSVKNPRKSPSKVDPAIDINDIYGVQKYGTPKVNLHQQKPVGNRGSTRQFDYALGPNKRMRSFSDSDALQDSYLNSNYYTQILQNFSNSERIRNEDRSRQYEALNFDVIGRGRMDNYNLYEGANDSYRSGYNSDSNSNYNYNSSYNPYTVCEESSDYSNLDESNYSKDVFDQVNAFEKSAKSNSFWVKKSRGNKRQRKSKKKDYDCKKSAKS